mgnify:CR=1 FL=1
MSYPLAVARPSEDIHCEGMTHALGLARFFVLCTLLHACAHPQAERTSPSESGKSSKHAALQQRLATGWHTWNNPALLSHVLMPYGLSLQFSARSKRSGQSYLDESYVTSGRKPTKVKVEPGPNAVDGSYSSLVFEWNGVRARVQTATHEGELLMLYEPETLPKFAPVILFKEAMLWNRPGTLSRDGDTLVARLSDRTVTVFATETQAEVPLPIGSPYLAFESREAIGFSTGIRRTRAEIAQLVNTARVRFEANALRFGPRAESYRAISSVLGWDTIYDAFNRRVITPVSRTWNEAWGGYILFDWDTYFGAYMLSLDHKDLAYSNVIAITHEHTSDGFVPNVAASFDQKSYDRSQPPVGSLIVKAIYDRHGEKWFLDEVYDDLLGWNRWWPKARDNQGFLSWGSSPHPKGMQGNTKQGAMWESGLDNSPNFDDASFNEKTHMLDLASVDLMGLYVADCRVLAAIADVLGKTANATELRERADRYGAKLRELWNEEAGIFLDRNLRTGEPSHRIGPGNLYPLLAKVATQEQATRMVNEYLLNPKKLGGTWMIPSITRDDPAFPDNEYWRGRVWGPMNLLVYLGLHNYTLPEARKQLADASERLLLQEWQAHHHVYENYNSVTGTGGDVDSADSFYSWGGLLGFIGLIEDGHVKPPQY